MTGPRHTLPRSKRLQHDLEYQRVYGARVRKTSGPLAGFAAPNGRAFWRLGLSIGRQVGGAVERHRIKRAVREAFRLGQHDFPQLDSGGEPRGLDLIVSARAHDPLEAADYCRHVRELAAALHREWVKRDARHV